MEYQNWCYVCLFTGMGYASHLIITFGATSYIMILTWSFFYLFSSFSAELPWASCGNEWNTGIPVSQTVKFSELILQNCDCNETTIRYCVEPHKNVKFLIPLCLLLFWQTLALTADWMPASSNWTVLFQLWSSGSKCERN